MQKFPGKFYRSFTIQKSGGGERLINAPRRFLKTIQTWIYANICAKQVLDDCVTGFIIGKSIFDNGRVHANNGNLMVVDISDFFPSVKFPQVSSIFKALAFPKSVAHQLAALCCLDGCLPQGSPTSPSLSNLVFKPTDSELTKLTKEWGCTYTRYADDMAFSGDKVFSREDIYQVGEILRKFGFSVNEKKSRIIGRGGRQIVAGLVVNQSALPPRVIRRRWRATFHNATIHPKKFSNRVTNLFGIASFVKQYSPATHQNYRAITLNVLKSSK
jgi:retron-type reverse transcriptase